MTNNLAVHRLLVIGTAFLWGASVSAQFENQDTTSEYGFDSKTGVFTHPSEAPYRGYRGGKPTPDSLNYHDGATYSSNVKVLKQWPVFFRAGHTWQHIVDIDGGRYMFHYYRTHLNVYDITDPLNLKVVLEKEYTDGTWFGAAAIGFNEALQKWIMIQSFEVPRSTGGMKGEKYQNPEAVRRIKELPMLRGFRVYELLGPTEWELLSEVSMDPLHPNADIQEGSGGFDVPTYKGGKYAYMLGAPDNTFDGQEFPNQIYSPIHMIYDMADPVDPRLISTWWVPGQRRGEEEQRKAWRQNGNRTSWTGGRLPMSVPENQIGERRYGYTVMGGLGFHIIDITDPKLPTAVGSLDLPVAIGGVQGDSVDASRAVERGFVLVNGYPMNEDCYEPWKDVFVIDVRDPSNPKITGKLPRPMPPATAPFRDYCLRRGKFGPKRPSPSYAPGTPDPNVTIYPYFSGGYQIFDISDPTDAEIVGYFVPPMVKNPSKPEKYQSPTETIQVEWDRKLIWTFTTSGIYLLAADALGEPVLD